MKSMMCAALCAVAALVCGSAAELRAEELPALPAGEGADANAKETRPIVAEERRPYTAASAQSVRTRDLELRPVLRPADVLQVAPGLYVAQHAGGGKANQYFLRGFDIDHGTDLALFVDGIPVNAVTHGHGQGYADLNWLVPELVDRVEVYKGPYFAEFGDFATAGAVNIITRTTYDGRSSAIAGGMYNTWRGFTRFGGGVGTWNGYVAGDVYTTDGPFDNQENTLRGSGQARASRELVGGSSLELTMQAYGADWDASGQIPNRLVDTDQLDRFDSVDPDEGGNSERYAGSARWSISPTETTDTSLFAYVVHSRLQLYSDFTFLVNDPVNGDMIEQDDKRVYGGIDLRHFRIHAVVGRPLEATFGLQGRIDKVRPRLYNAPSRERLTKVRDNDVLEGSFAPFAQLDYGVSEWMRLVVGLRYDTFGFNVSENVDGLAPEDVTDGNKWADQLSPKASMVLGPWYDTELYLNYGRGFHSNDARSVVATGQDPDPLAKADGYEAGLRTNVLDRIDAAIALFQIDLASELVWVGDEGTTEASGKTRRQGVEFEGRVRMLDWLWADVDVTYSDGEFRDEPSDADEIPLAPRWLIQSGISVERGLGWYGRLQMLHLGDRPATEDGFIEADGFTRFDALVGYQADWWNFQLFALNLFDVNWRDAQFATTSRVAGENDPSACVVGSRPVTDGSGAFQGCEDNNFTPGWPFTLRARIEVEY